jgi:triphosphatase
VIPVVGGSSPLGHPKPKRRLTVEAAFRSVVQDALARIETNAHGMRSSSDPEHLHQLRVGLRRLRSALRAFHGIVAEKETKRLRRSLRKLSRGLGRARDWDVLVARLESGKAPTHLLLKARMQRDEARAAAKEVIASKKFARALVAARAISPRESGQSMAEFAGAALARAHRKLMKEARSVDWQDPAQRHAVRIRLKRLRYSCEFFAPAFDPRRSAAYVGALKALQEILGELNDIAVGRERLPEFAAFAEEAALVAKLAPAWARFERRSVFWR